MKLDTAAMCHLSTLASITMNQYCFLFVCFFFEYQRGLASAHCGHATP